MDNEPAYNLLFNRNPFDNLWYCFTRNDAANYFSDRNNEDAKIVSGTTQEYAYYNWMDKYGKDNANK